jgi:hypothetical protein
MATAVERFTVHILLSSLLSNSIFATGDREVGPDLRVQAEGGAVAQLWQLGTEAAMTSLKTSQKEIVQLPQALSSVGGPTVTSCPVGIVYANSVDGNDALSGCSPTNAVRSLVRAQAVARASLAALRKMRVVGARALFAAPSAIVTVNLTGEFRNQTLSFIPADSGSKWTGSVGMPATLSGSVQLDDAGWMPAPADVKAKVIDQDAAVSDGPVLLIYCTFFWLPI